LPGQTAGRPAGQTADAAARCVPAGWRHDESGETTMTPNMIDQLSDALADRLAVAAAVSVQGAGRPRSGILWRPDVVVTSEQVIGDGADFTVVQAGTTIAA